MQKLKRLLKHKTGCTTLRMPDELAKSSTERAGTKNTWTVDDLPSPRLTGSEKRVLFLATADNAVGHYRLWVPAKYTAKSGLARVRVANTVTQNDFGAIDVVVCNTITDKDVLCAVEDLQAHGTKFVYDIDDNLEKVPRTNAARAAWEAHPEKWECIKRAVRVADLVTVATPELAGFYHPRNRNIHIIKNYMDFENPCFDATRESIPNLTIGFAGSPTHTQDLVEIKYAMEYVLKKYPAVVFAFCGSIDWVQMFDVPRNQLLPIKWTDLVHYPLIFTCFDIAVAPLSPTPFNHYKTSLKLQDSCAVGVPTIASDVTPYTRFACEGKECGYGDVVLLSKRPGDWIEHLERMIEDKSAREDMGYRARAFVRDEYSAETHMDVWWNAYKTLF